MSRLVCHMDAESAFTGLCVNNYRGEDYGKPDTCVDCDECIFNPENKGLKRNPKDSDKVIKTKVIILDNNPLSIACYMDEHPETFKEKKNAKDKSNLR